MYSVNKFMKFNKGETMMDDCAMDDYVTVTVQCILFIAFSLYLSIPSVTETNLYL